MGGIALDLGMGWGNALTPVNHDPIVAKNNVGRQNIGNRYFPPEGDFKVQ